MHLLLDVRIVESDPFSGLILFLMHLLMDIKNVVATLSGLILKRSIRIRMTYGHGVA